MGCWRWYNGVLKEAGIEVTDENRDKVDEMIHQCARADIPIIVICAYNATILNKTNDPINLYTELVRSHGTVLFTEIDNNLGRMEIRKA